MKILKVRKIDEDFDVEELMKKEKILRALVEKLNAKGPVDASSGSRMSIYAVLGDRLPGRATITVPYHFSDGTLKRLEQKARFYQDCLKYSAKVMDELKKAGITNIEFRC